LECGVRNNIFTFTLLCSVRWLFTNLFQKLTVCFDAISFPSVPKIKNNWISW
jgi:hypothetical protein